MEALRKLLYPQAGEIFRLNSLFVFSVVSRFLRTSICGARFLLSFQGPSRKKTIPESAKATLEDGIINALKYDRIKHRSSGFEALPPSNGVKWLAQISGSASATLG